MVTWREHTKQKSDAFPVNKFEAHGMTEKEASLAALRSAVYLRARMVGLQSQNDMNMIKVVEKGF